MKVVLVPQPSGKWEEELFWAGLAVNKTKMKSLLTNIIDIFIALDFYDF